MGNINKKLYFILEELNSIDNIIKKGRHKLRKKNIKDRLLKGLRLKDYKRNNILKKARLKAHTPVANAYRSMSQNIKG